MRRENGSTEEARDRLLEMPKALREIADDPQNGLPESPKITIEVQGYLLPRKK